MSVSTRSFLQKEVSKDYKLIANNIRGVSKLPRDVIIHHMADDGSKGPRPTSLMFKPLLEENDNVYVYNIMEIHNEGLFGRTYIPANGRKADKEFFTHNRVFSRVHNLDRILKRGKAPIIYNYNHIFSNYKATNNQAIYNIYRNMGNFGLLWKTVAELDTESVQLITIRLPRIVKELSRMRLLVEKPNKTNLLEYSSPDDIYLYSLMAIVYSEEFIEEVSKRNVIFRIVDGLHHVDIPYNLICNEISKKGSTPIQRLTELYDILNALIELRVTPIDENVSVHDLKATEIKIDIKEDDILNVESNIQNVGEDLLKRGVISDKELSKAIRDAGKFKSIQVGGKTIGDILKESEANKREVPKSTIPKLKLPIGESIQSNVVQEMDREYVKTGLEQDLIENLTVLSKSGHIILGIKKEEVRDAATNDVVYSVQTKHLTGSVGTMKIVIPKINEQGVFQSGNVKYRLGRQRMTLPIVKTSPRDVAMTSSRSKIFATVGRAATDNIGTRVSKMITTHILDGNITEYKDGGELKPGNKMGMVEGAIFEEYSVLVYKGLKLDFEKGHKYRGDPVKFTAVGDIKGKENYGNILTLLDIPFDKMGLPHSEIKIKGAHVPISLILASWIGLDELFKRIGVVVTEYDLGKRVDKTDGPVIRFKDVKVQVKYRNMEQLILINGLRKNEKYLRDVERDMLDRPAGWSIVFTLMGLGRSQERGVTAFRTRWVDAITNRLLRRQGYPTDMENLLLSVNKLLSTSEFKRETDGKMMFIRGQDRVNDIVYREIMVAMDEFDTSSSRNRKLTINPRATKMAILSDALVSPTEDTSPVNLISNQTRMGYGGGNGRSDNSMVGRHRVFDENDVGVISEAGTDDGKSGTVLNTPVNPNFDSIYGTTADTKVVNEGSVLSINSVVAPFILHDEVKRTIFARIQGNSMVYAEGYRVMPVYTGGGIVAGQQVDGNYTFIAKDDGVIRKITPSHIEVKYKTEGVTKYPLGREYSRNSGKIYPKQLVTDFKVKDTFRKGAVLIWDKNYFTRNMIEEDQVELYTGCPVIIAIKDEMDVYEDACTFDQDDGNTAMASNVIHQRALGIPFTSNFKLLVKVGDKVSPNTPCAIITPEGVEITEDESNLDFMSKVTPKVKHSGTVVRIEAHYMGDKKDASKGIRKVLDASDRQFKDESEYKDVHPNGNVSEPTFINQEYLDKNTAVITVYVEHLDGYSVGDKSSDCNALKSVNGYAWKGRIETLAGIKVSGKFSGDGIFRRVTPSAFSLGILNFSQYTAGRAVIKAYRGDK